MEAARFCYSARFCGSSGTGPRAVTARGRACRAACSPMRSWQASISAVISVRYAWRVASAMAGTWNEHGPVGAETRAAGQPCGGDLLDAEQVTVGQCAAWLAGMDRMVVAGAEDQVPCAGLGAVGDAHRGPGRDDAEADDDRSQSGPAVRPDHDLARRSSLRPRRGPDRRYGHAARPGRLLCGADGYLLAKLVSSYSCPLASGSWRRPWRWPGKLAPGRQSACGINAGAGRGAVSLRCPAGRGAIAMDAG